MKDSYAHRVNAVACALWGADDVKTDLVAALNQLIIMTGPDGFDPEHTGTICEVFGSPNDKTQVIGEQSINGRMDKVFMRQFADTSVLIYTEHSVIAVVEPVSW